MPKNPFDLSKFEIPKWEFEFDEKEIKRKPIPLRLQRKLLLRCKGKCEQCHIRFARNLKAHIHHKDGNPKNNKESNLKVLCPNCHSKAPIHDRPKPKKEKPSNVFGLPEPKIPLGFF